MHLRPSKPSDRPVRLYAAIILASAAMLGWLVLATTALVVQLGRLGLDHIDIIV